MTGFGRCELSSAEWDFVAEVRTLNHRYLEINVKLPGVLSPLEMEVREVARSLFVRGKVDVFLSMTTKGGKPVELSLNEEVVDEYISIAEKAKEKFGLSGELTVQDVLSLRDAVIVEEERLDIEAIKAPLMKCVETALANALVMRENEGKNIGRSLRKLLKKLEELSSKIGELAEENKKQKIQRMKERIEELMSQNFMERIPVDESRLMTEVAFLLDRFDVTEEVERISSHLEQFRKALGARKESVGRKLDFIIQEIHREFNTIGSKCQNSVISSLVVDGKAIVEKMREQIQNVE